MRARRFRVLKIWAFLTEGYATAKERWKNHIESVFACEDTAEDDIVTATEYMIDDGNESEITMDESIKALKRMKVGKATGYDRVWSEMLRDGRGV
ncbi:hypothetical protein EVAR_34484_1 [Eumeta japonica]|uniref:Uncharacterized protein n=1 Tax=Eumeta variegata TaxID=151549 RepID=A0A4C1WXY2_EUMVA|nr:hypothetical protein EVAR_34484_1 [Eumeta japonica]